MGDMGDLIAVDPVQELGCPIIPHRLECRGELSAEIEIRLFEGQAQPGHEVDRMRHRRHGPPEISRHGHLTEGQAALRHATAVHPGVVLLLLQGLDDASSERCGGVREAEQHQRHQLGGEQFVVGEEVEETPPLSFLFQRPQIREVPTAPRSLEAKGRRTSRMFRGSEG